MTSSWNSNRSSSSEEEERDVVIQSGKSVEQDSAAEEAPVEQGEHAESAFTITGNKTTTKDILNAQDEFDSVNIEETRNQNTKDERDEQETSELVQEFASFAVSNGNDDFGGFNTQSNDEEKQNDDFGSFDDTTQPVHSVHATPQSPQDDEFGGFNALAAPKSDSSDYFMAPLSPPSSHTSPLSPPAPTASSLSPAGGANVASSTTTPTTTIQQQKPIASAVEAVSFPESIQTALNAIASLTITTEQLEKAIKDIYPISQPISSWNNDSEPTPSLLVESTDSPSGQKQFIPNPAFVEQDWTKLYSTLTSSSYDFENEARDRFRWRKSAIRREFLNAVGSGVGEVQPQTKKVEGSKSELAKTASDNKPIPSSMVDNANTSNSNPALSSTSNLKTASTGTLSSSTSSTSAPSTTTPVKYDPAKAKELCEITEAQLSSMPLQSLTSLLSEIKSTTLLANEHFNSLLDHKEQLMLDAEMHNKMIASLVQYAQTKSVAKGATKGKGKNR